MIAQELELALHNAFVGAREKRHQFITVEHLLLALLDGPNGAGLLQGCGANVENLRKTLTAQIAEQTPVFAASAEVDTQPTLGFQRIIQRAVLQVQSSGKKEVNSADVVLAILGEKDSHAVYFLQQQGIARLDVVNYISHGITKPLQADQGQAVKDPPAAASADGAAPTSASIGRELEVDMHMAFVEARQKRHEFITVEHLLRALLENPTAAEVLRACGADMEELRKNLTQHIAEHTPVVASDREVDTQPTLGFQRVIQRAILHVESSGKKEVTGANVLVAIFGEKDSHAAFFLQQQGATRLNVVTYMSHGVVSEQSTDKTVDASDVKVVLYDDESTPMEFVARVLQEFFGMGKEEAAETMLDIYRHGKAVCGLYSREDGETLVGQVAAYARENGHPLRCATVAPA
jgi:ATP-dependent Clp protease ATP-binding subunit ClpA